MWQIVSSKDKKLNELKPKRISYTYLHGKLEEDCEHDVYGFINCDLPLEKEGYSYVDDTKIEDGKYPCEYENKLCTLYFWHCLMKKPHGLVVYNDDYESIQYAKKCLNEKVGTI